LGVNGAGKTTTFNMIIKSIRPTNGYITLNQKSVHHGGFTGSNKLIGY